MDEDGSTQLVKRVDAKNLRDAVDEEIPAFAGIVGQHTDQSTENNAPHYPPIRSFH